jgi:hypothetical protein
VVSVAAGLGAGGNLDRPADGSNRHEQEDDSESREQSAGPTV